MYNNLIIEMMDETIKNRRAEEGEWEIVRRDGDKRDVRERLERMGLDIVAEDPLFYVVTQPPGWSKKKNGIYTSFSDETGRERITQFYDRQSAIHQIRAEVTRLDLPSPQKSSHRRPPL